MTNVHPAAKRIVVGVDGSTQSQQALRWAARFASTMQARINAVAVWDFPVTYGWGLPADWNPGDDMKKLLTETVELALGPERAPDMTLTIRQGGAAHVLLEESADALMLVVGSRGHGGFAGLLLGSVSAAVAEHATCPVLVVHGDQPVPEATS
ncbi:MAG TPA: universal stress protein [Micromonosporaceae bacterium]|nr:universal stress protein [Micromonosporaceae bacterium]